MVEPLELVGETDASGLKLRLLPDPTILKGATFVPNELQTAIQRLAYVCPGLVWSFCGQILSKPDGLLAYLADTAGGLIEAGSMGLFECKVDEAEIVFAVALKNARRSSTPSIASWANWEFTSDGGSHVDGMQAGLEAAYGAAVRKLGSRIVGAIHVVVREPMFEGETKAKLVNRIAEPIVRDFVASELSKQSDLRIAWLEALSRLDK